MCSKDNIKVVLSEKIIDKIKYLCKTINKVEWSGILLYTVEGTIKDPSKMVLTAQEIILMDMGSSAYTEYNYNEKKRDTSEYLDRHIDYTNEHPEALGWKIGQIHSHHSMRVFFSSTDMSELVENSDAHNYYLSVIVNNYMDIIGKVAFQATAEAIVPIPYKAIDDEGEEYEVSTSNFKVSTSVLITHECKIEAPVTKLTVEEEFANNVADVIKIATTPKVVTPAVVPASRGTVIPSSTNPEYKRIKSDTLLPQEKTDNPFDDIVSEDDYELDSIELFTMELLTGGDVGECQDLIDVLSTIEIVVEDNPQMASSISENFMSNYPETFTKMFADQLEEDEIFEEVTQMVIELLEENETSYKFLSKTIMALKYMLNQFEKYGDSTAVR